LPGAIVPLVQLAVYAPPGAVIPLTVNVAFPLFVIVNVAVACDPTWTLPNAKFPLSPIIRVAVGVGEVAVLSPPPHAAARLRSRTTQPHFNVCMCALLN